MNIYIYGSDKFKNDMSKVLSKNSIKDKLSEISQADESFGKIIKVATAKELRDIIEEYSHSIFLIDHTRIVYDSFWTNIFSFLKPKDGIKQKFLEKHEIAIKVEYEDVATIAQCILDRLETYNINEITRIEDIREDDIISVLENINNKG